MQKAVIAATGLFTPPYSISNIELVETFNTYVANFNAEHAVMASEAGYQNATTTQRGLAGPQDGAFLLPRVGIWRSTHMLRFFQKCLTNHENRRRG